MDIAGMHSSAAIAIGRTAPRPSTTVRSALFDPELPPVGRTPPVEVRVEECVDEVGSGSVPFRRIALKRATVTVRHMTREFKWYGERTYHESVQGLRATIVHADATNTTFGAGVRVIEPNRVVVRDRHLTLKPLIVTFESCAARCYRRIAYVEAAIVV